MPTSRAPLRPPHARIEVAFPDADLDLAPALGLPAVQSATTAAIDRSRKRASVVNWAWPPMSSGPPTGSPRTLAWPP